MPILKKRIKTNSKFKQQQQTLKTSKNLCSFYKTKLKNKVKIASDKTEAKQNNLSFTRKDMGPVHSKAWQQLDKKEQKQ